MQNKKKSLDNKNCHNDENIKYYKILILVEKIMLKKMHNKNICKRVVCQIQLAPKFVSRLCGSSQSAEHYKSPRPY